MSPHSRRNDSGYSLVELLVATSIGVIVLGVVFMVLQASFRSFEVVDTTTKETSAARDSLDATSRLLREAEDIIHAEDYAVEFTADYDDDHLLEYLRFEAKADGTFTQTVRNTPAGSVVFKRVIASNCRNVALGQPVFAYYRAIGIPALPDASFSPPKDGDRLTKTTIVDISLLVQDPARPSVLTGKTAVTLRNSQS